MTATPFEVDTELARLYGLMDQNETQRRRAYRAMSRLGSSWMSKAHQDEERAKLTKVVDGCDRVGTELQDQATPLEYEYFKRNWNRYYLVTNANGHVHSSTSCTTCFHTTQFSWLVDLADKPVADMVEEWGEMACTVCFPDAPTLPRFSEPSRRDQAAQAERAAEKAAREAKKAEKNLTPEQCFRDYHNSKVTTVAGAKKALRDAVELANYGVKGERHPWADAADVAADTARIVLLERGVTETEMEKIKTNKMKAWGKQMGWNK